MPIESDFSESFRCGACGARQSVYLGDPNDLTLPDVDAVECCYCGFVELLGYDDWGGESEKGREDWYVQIGEPMKE